MSLSEFSLKNRYTVYVIFIAAVVFGVIAYRTLPVQLFPDTAPPLVNILTPYPGAAAEDVADLVSDPIEEEAASLEGVAAVSSTSQNGLSLVEVEFRYGVSTDLAAVDVQNAIARIRSSLPREIGEPQVLKFSTSNKPVLTMGLGGKDLATVRRLAEDVFAPELQRLGGVALVDVFGGHRPEVSVRVDKDRLEAHRLPLAAVTEAIRDHNISEPSGQIKGAGRHFSFRIDVRSSTLEGIASIPITTSDGRRILVGDVADVVSGSGEDLSRFRVDGSAAIAVQVFKQEDANTVAVVEKAQAKFADLRKRYPEVDMLLANEDASFARQVVDSMLDAVIQALALAALIIFLFLGSFKRGLVVSVSMPLSFLLAFAGMRLFGLQLDMITLTAIILAVGMVVDASVVILENISRKFSEEKRGALQAAIEGAKEIEFSIIAGNLTTLVVLVPLLFLYGYVGKTFGPLAATLIIAFVSSLIVALVIVPLLTTFVMNDEGKLEGLARKLARPWGRLMDSVRNFYVEILRISLRARWVVLAVALISFVAGLALLRNLGMEMLPKMDGGTSFVTVETPSGSALEDTERVMAEVEAAIREEAEFVRMSTQVGFEPGMRSFGGGGVQGPTQGYTTITWKPRTERKDSIWDIQDRLRLRIGKIPNIQNFVVRESGSTAKSTTSASIVVKIKGDDPLVLDRLGTAVVGTISQVPGVVNPYRNWRLDQRIVSLDIDTERSRELGLTPRALARDVSQALDGMGAGALRDEEGYDTPIVVRYDEAFRRHKEDVYGVLIISRADGKALPFGVLAEGKDKTVQGLVTREDLLPTLDILALHQGRPLSFVAADVEAALAGVVVPAGYSLSVEGENKDMSEAKSEILKAILMSIIAVYLLLVAQFKSFLHPITVMIAIPLSLIGVSLALYLAGKPVSMPVLIGLVLLIGTVVNSSIILIDFIVTRRQAGAARHEAILESVATRFRPIMMTSLSTIVGMIPLAMEAALGTERFSPLAVAVMGGMTAATFLTLIVIPVLYDVFEDLRDGLSRAIKGKQGGRTGLTPPESGTPVPRPSL